LAHVILGLGDEIFVEDMDFRALAKRAKKTERNAKDKFTRKKRFGKSILRKSPGLPLRINDQKLQYQGNKLQKVDTWKVKASQYRHLDETYKKKPLGTRWKDFSEIGHGMSQRDRYSAFLLMWINPDLQSIHIELCDRHFATFKELHDREVRRLSAKNNLSSRGIKKAG
jgi:hypothetical protein